MQQPPKHSYEYWRLRILYSTMLGYVFFYFIRKNFSMAMSGIEREFGYTEEHFGLMMMLHGLLYGFSRFANGILADKLNPRYFMAAGLLLCVICNFCLTIGNTIYWFAIFWIANGWFQGMGFPPCAKSLSHWFAAEERGVVFSIWNTSHSIGAGLILVINAIAIYYFDEWRLCFIIPSLIGFLGVFFLFNRLRDTPESMGLRSVEEYYLHKKRNKKTSTHDFVSTASNNQNTVSDHADDVKLETIDQKIAEILHEKSWGHTLFHNVFMSPAIWIVAFANFFVYIVRFTILDWAPHFLEKARGIELVQSGFVSCCFEFSGVFGMLCSGFLMDRYFRGRGSKVCCLCMLGCTIMMTIFWYVNSKSPALNAFFLATLGFFSYGPQCLIGVIVANVATKKAAAAANGVTGILGYLSVIVTGWGVGKMVKIENIGWDGVFFFLICCSFVAMLLFLFVLNAAAPEQLEKERLEQLANEGKL